MRCRIILVLSMTVMMSKSIFFSIICETQVIVKSDSDNDSESKELPGLLY